MLRAGRLWNTGPITSQSLERLWSDAVRGAPWDSVVGPADTPLVSYPRSGNTWTRCILAHLLYPNTTIDSLKSLNKLVPDIHKSLPTPGRDRTGLVFKTHRPYEFRPGAATGVVPNRAIYIIRHPARVAKSLAHYQARQHGIDGGLDRAVYQLVTGDYICGAWDRHALSWYARREVTELLVIRYEDLMRDTPGEIMRISAHLGLRVERDTAEAISRACSRKEMVRLEKRGTITSRPMAFIRGGDRRNSDEDLSEDHLRVLKESLGYAMSLFDYD